MATTRPAPHYKECPCKLHGKVYLPDGTSSLDLFSLPEALIFYSLCIEKGLLKEGEEAVLLRRIMESGLPQVHVASELKFRFIWLIHEYFEIPLDLPRPRSVFMNRGNSLH